MSLQKTLAFRFSRLETCGRPPRGTGKVSVSEIHTTGSETTTGTYFPLLALLKSLREFLQSSQCSENFSLVSAKFSVW